MSLRACIIMLWLCCASRMAAQHSCVVADSQTRQPIFRASLYCKEHGVFQSAITDEHGRATIGFAFRRLTVSHLNYEKKQLSRLADTIFLSPRDYLTEEVVVRQQEPPWLRPMLRRFAKEKEQHYYNHTMTLDYRYETQSISSRRFYQYESEGLLRTISPDSSRFAFNQSHGTITAVDTTRLTDMANLRRMLYEDFVQEFSASFIRAHRFYVNDDYQGTPGTVELAFRSKNEPDDRGRFVIDTTRCVILRATRKMGIKHNLRHRLSRMLYLTARAISGYKITDWDTDYSVSYADDGDGCFYPNDIAYKLYFMNTERQQDKQESEYTKQTGGGFANMEARLLLSAHKGEPQPVNWTPLPRHYYIRLSSDEERQLEVKLSHMPASFHQLPDSSPAEQQ